MIHSLLVPPFVQLYDGIYGAFPGGAILCSIVYTAYIELHSTQDIQLNMVIDIAHQVLSIICTQC